MDNTLDPKVHPSKSRNNQVDLYIVVSLKIILLWMVIVTKVTVLWVRNHAMVSVAKKILFTKQFAPYEETNRLIKELMRKISLTANILVRLHRHCESGQSNVSKIISNVKN